MTEDRAGLRSGWGFDAHRLTGAPPLVLGGVVLSDELGVDATSDGDVLAHAVTDALLGACVLGDMGEHYPSEDPAWINVDSMALLSHAVSLSKSAGWRPVHADATVVAESIRVSPRRAQIRSNLGSVLELPTDAVSVKATTTDGLGFIGRGEGLAAFAVVTVESLS